MTTEKPKYTLLYNALQKHIVWHDENHIRFAMKLFRLIKRLFRRRLFRRRKNDTPAKCRTCMYDGDSRYMSFCSECLNGVDTSNHTPYPKPPGYDSKRKAQPRG